MRIQFDQSFETNMRNLQLAIRKEITRINKKKRVGTKDKEIIAKLTIIDYHVDKAFMRIM